MKHISIYSDNIYIIIMIMAADISRFYLIIIFQHRPLNSPPPPTFALSTTGSFLVTFLVASLAKLAPTALGRPASR